MNKLKHCLSAVKIIFRGLCTDNEKLKNTKKA